MLSFLLAFLFMCVLHSDKLTRVFVGVMWFVVFGLVLMCIVEGRDDSWWTRRWLWESGREVLDIIKVKLGNREGRGNVWGWLRRPNAVPGSVRSARSASV